jgi:uncharacterized membrane protein
VAALAYLLPPLSGMVAYFMGSEVRVRWHGLQSVVLGVVWPGALYAGSLVSVGATQAAAAAGSLVWLAFLAGTVSGHDPGWPGAGRWLRRMAEGLPRSGP